MAKHQYLRNRMAAYHCLMAKCYRANPIWGKRIVEMLVWRKS